MFRRGLRGPVAEEISLGWVLSGCVGSSLVSSDFVSTHILKLSEASYAEAETIHSSIHERDQVLLGEVKKFGELEDICDASSKSIHSFIHEKRFDSLQSFIKFEKGRYTVQLPWKTDSLMLPYNFLPGKQRLISLLKRLKQKPELLNEYNEIISKQEKEGIIETVEDPTVAVSSKTCYIQHGEAVQEDRVTTKTRKYI